MGPSTKHRKKNSEVFVGTLERIEKFFHWQDDHWMLPKTKLLERVKEWNAALEQYCDDIGLTGDERVQIIKQHKASPFAPCANESCSKVEKSVKDFFYALCAELWGIVRDHARKLTGKHTPQEEMQTSVGSYCSQFFHV